MIKHEKACFDNQYIFILFIFDTFRFLAPDVVDLLKIIQMVMHNNVVLPRSTNVIFQRLNFTIYNGLATQFVVRVSFIQV
jgi:hypothetical protein